MTDSRSSRIEPEQVRQSRSNVPLERGGGLVALIAATALLLLGAPLADAFFPTLDARLRTALYLLSLAGTGAILLVLARMFGNLPLRIKFLTVCLVFALIPLLLVSMASNRMQVSELHRQTHSLLGEKARQHAAALDERLQGVLESVRVDALLPPFIQFLDKPAGLRTDADRLAVRGVLEALYRRSTIHISSFALLDSDGRNILDTFSDDRMPDKKSRQYFKVTKSTGVPQISDVMVSPVTGRPSLFFSAPVLTPAGRFAGMLRVRYDAGMLQDFLRERIMQAEVQGMAVMLLDENAVRLADSRDVRNVLSPLSRLGAEQVRSLEQQGRLRHDRRDSDEPPDLQGVARYIRHIGVTPGFLGRIYPDDQRVMFSEGVLLQHVPWRLIMTMPLGTALEPVRRRALINTLMCVLWSVLAGLAAILAANAVSGPLMRVADFVGRIGQGDLDAKAPVESTDEVGRLAEALNAMSAGLRVSQDQLRNNASRWRALLDTLPDTVLVLDPDGRIENCNRRFQSMFGLGCQDVRSRGWARICRSGEDLAVMQERLAAARRIGSMAFDWVGLRSDGSTFPARVRLRSLMVPEGARLLAVITDVSESRRMERETEGLRMLLQETVDAMPSVLLGLDADGRIVLWNHHVELQSGVLRQGAVGALLKDVWPSKAHLTDLVIEALTSGRIVARLKETRVTPDGTRFEDVLVYPLPGGVISGAVVRIDDVTERSRFEEMIVQSEKMMSLGGLAAGMAHEINNPLAAMLGNTQIIRQRLFDPILKNVRVAGEVGVDFERVRAYAHSRGLADLLQVILDSGRRAADIVLNMLSFSRSETSCKNFHSLADLLDRSLELSRVEYDLARQFDFQQIEIVRAYDPEVRDVPCDPGKIQQVLINILRNAADAMAEKVYVAPITPRLELGLGQQGEQIVLTITDNGPGIPEDVRSRIFEPFFTTKPVGQGTGLGLSVSYFIIVDEHGGTLTVDSCPGEWTRFRITLPCSNERCSLLLGAVEAGPDVDAT